MQEEYGYERSSRKVQRRRSGQVIAGVKDRGLLRRTRTKAQRIRKEQVLTRHVTRKHGVLPERKKRQQILQG